MLSPCQPEMGTKATDLGLYPTFLMKVEVSLIISLKRSSLHFKNSQPLHIDKLSETNLGRVHLVDGNNELPDTEGKGKESVLSSLTILGNTSFEFTGTTGNDENSTVSLRCSGNHVLDEVTVSRGINNLKER